MSLPAASTTRREFAERVLGMLNEAGVALMMSIGARVGLFDALDGQPPLTSEELARRAGLDERYVREWLAVMVTGRVVDLGADEGTYVLPEHRADFLTTRAGTTNLTVQANYVPLMGQVEEELLDCFYKGGGLTYDRFPRFHELMAKESGAVFDDSLVDEILPLVPGLVGRLEAGIDVADVGCGSGHAVNVMARRFAASRFVGLDLSTEAIETARLEAAAMGLDNARFEVRDAASLGEHGSYDFVTSFDSVHDQARPDLMLQGIATSLREGGSYLCVDISAHSSLERNLDHPLGPWMYAVSCMHCMTVSLAYDGMGLGTMWGEELAHEMLHEAGFSSVTSLPSDDDIVNNYYLASKD